MDAPLVKYVHTPDGFDIAYSVAGQGRPVILMPAPVSHVAIEWNSASYGPVLRAMSSRYRLIRFDFRGSGMSSRGLPVGFSGDEYQTDLECLIQTLGLHRVVLVGRIVSGNVAVKYARAHPERVQALILWNTEVDYHESFAHSHLELARTHWDHVLSTIARAYFPRDGRAQGLELVRQCVEREDFVRRVQVPGAYSIASDAARLRVPVLVLGSSLSEGPSESVARRVAALIPGARLRILARGGGFISQGDEAPGIVAVIEEFLESLAASELLPEASLTEREMDVLRLVAAGKSNQQIGDDLGISPNTVARHLSNIFNRTGSANRAGAVAYAYRHHLV